MSEEFQQKLRDQLWEVANKLRGNMSASDFMYFTLSFIFYKYLSEKIEVYANTLDIFAKFIHSGNDFLLCRLCRIKFVVVPVFDSPCPNMGLFRSP